VGAAHEDRGGDEEVSTLGWYSDDDPVGRLAAKPAAPKVDDDRLLTAAEAAALVGLTVDQLKRRRSLPFRKKVGHRTVRYSERGIRRWLERKTG
jgi:predicted DNA-binding transcriptional regulator AlpA